MAQIEKIGVEKITVRIGDVRIDLTPDQARRLATELSALFDSQPVYMPHVAPIVISPTPIPPWTPGITWSSHNDDYSTLTSATGYYSALIGVHNGSD